MITIVVKDFGNIVLEMDYLNAPNTARNFVKLARGGFYNGLTFHRIIKGFMIQGGDPLGNGTGGPSYHIKGEFLANGFKNNLSHKRGVISMARSLNYNSAGSQFFIMHQDALYLDGQYAAFGKVIKGLDVVDKIASVKTNSNDRPLKDVVIEKMIVEDEKDEIVEKM